MGYIIVDNSIQRLTLKALVERFAPKLNVPGCGVDYYFAVDGCRLLGREPGRHYSLVKICKSHEEARRLREEKIREAAMKNTPRIFGKLEEAAAEVASRIHDNLELTRVVRRQEKAAYRKAIQRASKLRILKCRKGETT